MTWMSKLVNHPNYVSVIGMLSIEIVNLEMMLADLFSVMLNIPGEMGHAIYLTPKSAMARIEIFQNTLIAGIELRKKHKQNNSDEMKLAFAKTENILGRAHKLMGKRHDYLHNTWGISEETNSVVRSKLPTRGVKEDQPIPLEELQRLITDIRNLYGEGFSLKKMYLDLHHKNDGHKGKTPAQTQDAQELSKET